MYSNHNTNNNIMTERSADHKIIKATKHFISVSNQDSNDYGTASHNPGQIYISFGNSGITNVQSYNDSTTTMMTPISLTADIFYYNVSQAFRNNKFRLSTITNDASPAIRVGATAENVAPITITIPDGIYKSGAEVAAAVQVVLNAKLVAWIGGNVINTFTVLFSAATNVLTLAYTTAAPAGIIAVAPILVLTTTFSEDGLAYDSSRIWGTTGAVQVGIFVTGSFLLPYANKDAGLPLPSGVDIQTLQVLRVHSNVSKRYFAKRGGVGASPAQRPLSLTDILFEIPLDATLNQTMSWQPPDNRFQQEISSNFDELRLTFTDNKDNVISFVNSAEINFTFAIDRQIIVPSNDERIKALSDYNRFKSM